MIYFSNTVRSGWLNLVAKNPELNEAGTHPTPDTILSQVTKKSPDSIADLQDEQQWETAFNRTQPALVAAARQAKQQRAARQATPMDYNQL